MDVALAVGQQTVDDLLDGLLDRERREIGGAGIEADGAGDDLEGPAADRLARCGLQLDRRRLVAVAQVDRLDDRQVELVGTDDADARLGIGRWPEVEGVAVVGAGDEADEDAAAAEGRMAATANRGAAWSTWWTPAGSGETGFAASGEFPR